jgi:hypothetical protein
MQFQCNEILTLMCKDNQDLELYIAQWIEMFLQHALQNEEDPLNARNIVKTLVNNNRRLLDEYITEDTIRKFIRQISISNKKSHKNLNLLTAILNAEGFAVKSNQDAVFKLFIEEEII